MGGLNNLCQLFTYRKLINCQSEASSQFSVERPTFCLSVCLLHGYGQTPRPLVMGNDCSFHFPFLPFNKIKNGDRTVPLTVKFFPKPVFGLTVSRIEKTNSLYFACRKFVFLHNYFLQVFLISIGKVSKWPKTSHLFVRPRVCILTMLRLLFRYISL